MKPYKSGPFGDPFFGAVLKVDWAKQHVRDINAAIGESLFGVKGLLYSHLTHSDWNDTSGACLPLRSMEKVREDIFMLASYALYNMRSALDHVACAISTGRRRHKAQFIIADSLSDFKMMGQKAIKDGRLSPQSLAFMRTFRPYARGNRPLHILHQLNIIDKHKTLMLVTAEGFTVSKEWREASRRRWRRLNPNSKFLPLLMGKTKKKNTQTFVNLTFPQIKSIKHEPIVIVLGRLAGEVEAIVEAARKTFPMATVPPL